jgi:hypothetical protein
VNSAVPSASSILTHGDENHARQNHLHSATEAVLSHGGDDAPQPVHEPDDDDPLDPLLEAVPHESVKGKEKDKLYVAANKAVTRFSSFSRKPAQFAILDTLLDKLLFIAVSGDGAIQPGLSLFPTDEPLRRSKFHFIFLTHLSEILHTPQCSTSHAKEDATVG